MMPRTAEEFFQMVGEILKLTPRGQQLQLSNLIESCLIRATHLIAEAPTGVGKTFAYLIPAVLYSLKSKKKVIIATASKDLQKQIVDKDLPILQKIVPFVYCMSIGSENYICSCKLSNGLQLGLFEGSDDLISLGRIAALQRQNPAATLLDCNFSVSESVKRLICRDSHGCMTNCREKALCSYTQEARKQRNANIIVTNHHKILHIIKNGSRNLNDIGAVVLDECHRLEGIATTVFSDQVETKNIIRTINELYNARSAAGILTKIGGKREHRNAMIDAVNSVAERLHDLYETAQQDQEITDADKDCLQQLRASLELLATGLQRSKVDALQHYSTSITDFAKTIDAILVREDSENKIYWKKITNRSMTYTATPLSVSDMLRKKLFRSSKINTVHVSATISTSKKGKNKMSFYRSTTGVTNAEEIIVDSPYDYKQQAAIYIPHNMPAPSTEEYLPEAIKEIGKIIIHFGGRTLILFTSLRSMNETHDILQARYPEFTFLKQHQGSTRHLVERFKKTEKAVLLGAGSYWEGLDIAGPCKKCVIAMRLPFDVPSDPVVVAHHEQLLKRGLMPFPTYLVPRAIIRFLQGFGRLIRSTTDSGVFVVMDSRVITERYGKRFLNALPKCRRIADITDFPAI